MDFSMKVVSAQSVLRTSVLSFLWKHSEETLGQFSGKLNR